MRVIARVFHVIGSRLVTVLVRPLGVQILVVNLLVVMLPVVHGDRVRTRVVTTILLKVVVIPR